nr:ribonuclease H-like domain-containing protein [Tanacetum cinerariifolium]
MDSQSTPVVSSVKLPILNPNEFDLWKMRIEQYFLMIDYSLWEVIINGDSLIPTVVVEGAVQPAAILTAEQKLARRNELKAHEEEQVVGPVVDMEEEQMAALVMDIEEDLAVLFGEDDDFEDDDFSDDDSEGVEEEEEVWEVNEEWMMAPVTPPPVPSVQPPSVYEVRGPSTAAAEGPSFPLPTPGLLVPPAVIEDLSTRLGNLEYRHGQLMKKVIQVSDAEVVAGVSIGEIGPRVFAIEGQVQVMASQMVHVADRWEQVGAQVEQGQQTATQRDETIVELTQQVHILQATMQQRDA